VATYTPVSASEIPGLLFQRGICSTAFVDGDYGTDHAGFAGQQLVPKRPNSGEVIDYYGPCSETSHGTDQPDAQQMDQYRWENKNTIPD